MARKDPVIEAAEEELIECMRLLRRLPDRERTWLYHSTLRWPAMIRDQGDYPDDSEPAGPLTRSEMRRVEAMFLDDRAFVRSIELRDVALVGVVTAIRASGSAGGWGWDDVWNALGGKLEQGLGPDGVMVMRKVTSEAMRMRYTRAIDRLARVIAAAAVCQRTPAAG